LAAGHLAWNFGWKPFIGDVIQLYEKLSSLEATLAKFKSQSGQILTRHYVKNLDQNKTWEINHDGVTSKCREQVTSNAVFRAHMKYTYTIPELNDQWANLKGLLDILGLKANLSVVWEAIPFSFAVDWFVNVDDFLKQFDTDWLESNVTILDFCYSLKTETVSDLFYQARWETSEGVENNYLARPVQVTTKRYQRKRTLPDNGLYGLELVDGFGTRQVGLATALLLA
jgi:hypothetical protein